MALESAAEKVGLPINTEETKIIELLDIDSYENKFDSIDFEKVEEFQYLGVLSSKKNDWSREISVRITKAKRASFALFKFLK